MTPRYLACVPRWMVVHPGDEAEWRFAKQEDEFGLGICRVRDIGGIPGYNAWQEAGSGLEVVWDI